MDVLISLVLLAAVVLLGLWMGGRAVDTQRIDL